MRCGMPKHLSQGSHLRQPLNVRDLAGGLEEPLWCQLTFWSQFMLSSHPAGTISRGPAVPAATEGSMSADRRAAAAATEALGQAGLAATAARRGTPENEKLLVLRADPAGCTLPHSPHVCK